ncbi:hypothetical protein BpHYR1_015389 [Brachionus plicatilis]|uniref:Uncharacterized protein n=1 Tax=Brachionus plicatilis TaxID=10195 RepID=A0A3M7PJM8_BRAPC|nr:hypothetical protein BpHYR1_015389 [Brachionus plicatilis]
MLCLNKSFNRLVFKSQVSSQVNDLINPYTYKVVASKFLDKNDYEKENSARKAELEKIKAENMKKLKKIVEKKILIETKINQVENQMLETNKEIDKHEKELFDESICSSISENAVFRTPAMANRRLINKLYSDKKNSTIKKNLDQEIVQFHANSNSLFSIALKVTEANKICCVLGFDYEFKKYEVPNPEDSDQKNPLQTISVTDKRLNLITLWNMDTFDLKLGILRDQYTRYVEEGSVSSLNSNQNEPIFLTDSSDEWQTIDNFLHKNETFSPRVIDHVINGSNDKKSFKRRLSYMNLNAISQSSLPSLPVANESDNEDNVDSGDFAAKKKCYGTPKIQNSIPVIPFTPGSAVKRKPQFDNDTNLNSSFDLSNQLSICNAFVYATCRDALNDDDFQIEDEDEFLNDTDDEENSESAKNVRSIPAMDDSNLKACARLIYDLNKLMDIHAIDKVKKFEMTKSMCSSSSLEEKSVDYLNHNNDQPLYCMKIVILYSQLSQFKPDYWSLHNEENVPKIKKVYSKIVKLLRGLKESINCLFKSIENNLDSLIKSKYDLIITQITKLFYLNGEYQLLICANTVLNRTNYSLMMSKKGNK